MLGALKKVQLLSQRSWTSAQNQVFLVPRGVHSNEDLNICLFIKECKSPKCRAWWDFL